MSKRKISRDEEVIGGSEISKLVRFESASDSEIAETFLSIEKRQVAELLALDNPSPIVFVYNPLSYAAEIHKTFIKKFCNSHKDVLFLGMNPGPWGMCQTGVPFGEVNVVRDWFKLSGPVKKPDRENPTRPVLGLDCKRTEVSGQRFWQLFQEICGTPEKFFKNCFVHNYCPFAYLRDSGKNVTPPEIKVDVRRQIQEICDVALCEVVKLLKVKTIIGVGNYAKERAKAALKNQDIEGIAVEVMMHPSPINPAANKGWKPSALNTLTDLGIMQYFIP